MYETENLKIIYKLQEWFGLGALAIQDLPHERLMSMWRSADKEPVVGDDRIYFTQV